jgi:hypothetical protein
VRFRIEIVRLDQRSSPRTAFPTEHLGVNKVAKIEERELERHRDEIVTDVKKLVEKYRAVFDWDVPDIDQTAADRLILTEVRRALDELEQRLLG